MMNFPFSAIVGQEQLRKALMLCAVDPGIGGVLIRGDKGTAKSTAARALAEVLPPIELVRGCAFNCTVDSPCEHCETCSHADRVATLSPVPFVTLPLGATEDRVLGSLDLSRALNGGQKVFQPGLLAAAHRGLLYIDEVNLLADHLVDVLLDVAAMGVNRVQREGLSVSHPARFTLVGTMNLEEGDLRPQLLDRFGLMVEVTAPREKAVRAEVVRRRIGFEADPAVYVESWRAQQDALQTKLATAQELLPQVQLDDALLDLISHLCCELEVASLRADIVMYKTARAIAALDARTQVTPQDIRGAAELVLPHRRRRKPFEQPGLDQDKLDDLMRQAQQDSAPQDLPPQAEDSSQRTQHSQQTGGGQQAQGTGQAGDEPPQQIEPPNGAKQSHDSEQCGREQPQDGGQGPQNNGQPGSEPARDGDQQAEKQQEHKQQDGEQPQRGQAEQVFVAAAGGPTARISVQAQSAPGESAAAGRRSLAQQASRGHVLRAVPNKQPTSIAIGATLRSAALRGADGGVQVTRADLHQQVRVGTSANLILFVVDASGSMAAQRRMEALKGAVVNLLTDAYQQRDEVAVVAFRGQRAELLLAPTRSVDLAEQGLRELPTGGRTPLPHALQLALETLQRASANARANPPLLVLLTDGKGNVPISEGGDPWRESLALAELLAERRVPALVIDTENGYLRLGRAAQLAQALGADCLTLEELSADSLALTVRARLA